MSGEDAAPTENNDGSCYEGALEMSKVCDVCGKHPSAGRNVSHSHRVTNRIIYPNVQSVTAMVDGSPKKIKVCTKCMKAGKITRA
jgi:large subunit ribosomal protein L28